jgi:hypothetical protein
LNYSLSLSLSLVFFQSVFYHFKSKRGSFWDILVSKNVRNVSFKVFVIFSCKSVICLLPFFL